MRSLLRDLEYVLERDLELYLFFLECDLDLDRELDCDLDFDLEECDLELERPISFLLGFYAGSSNQVKSLRYCKILPGENVLRN